MSELDIDPQTARVILNQEISLLKNTRYQLQVRHKVNKKIGAPEERLTANVTELENIEKMLDMYTQELQDLE